jgi:two-component system OmpR family response regulator
MKLLVVEDNHSQASLLGRAFSERGHAVDTCPNGEHAFQQLRTDAYDVVLLDWNLPGLDGVSVCRELRKAGNDTSVVMVSVRSDVKDKVMALEAGADDYLVKPVDLHELIARVQAVARRRVGGRAAVIRAGGITLSERERSVSVLDQPVELTQREFALLAYLMHRMNETVSRDEIVANVWTSMVGLGSNVIDVYVRRLRGKLGAAGAQLRTVRGIGYRFEPDESLARGS